MTTPALSLRGLRAGHPPAFTLDVPALDIAEGETLAVLGPNGAGKSTLLRCMALLERSATGELRFRGQSIRPRDAVAYRRRISMLFQEPLLLDTTVFENVATPLRLRGERGRRVREQVESWLERLGISKLARRPARVLSGGEARRVSLARALVTGPELLLLDEPFSALDAPTRAGFIRELAALLAEHRTTTVVVTHDPDEARYLADRAAFILAGRIRQIGSVDDVLDHPADDQIASFLSEMELPKRSGDRERLAGSTQRT